MLFCESLDQFRANSSLRAAQTDYPLEAAWLWGAAETISEAHSYALWPADQRAYAAALNSVQAQTDAPAFAAAWQTGRAATQDDACPSAYAILRWFEEAF